MNRRRAIGLAALVALVAGGVYAASEQQRSAVETLGNLVASQRLATAFSHRHALAMHRMTADRLVDLSGGSARAAPNQREILLLDLAAAKQPRQRFVRLDKEFIGRDAVLARKEQGIETRLVYVRVDADDADCIGNEPALDGERVMGVVTSGAYGFTVGQSIAFVYVDPGFSAPGSTFDVEILGQRRRATVLAEPLYDPANERLRA